MGREPVSRTTTLSRLRVHAVEWGGDDPPVVLLHPNRTNSRVWDFTVMASRRHDRVIAIDHRGHGDSEWPDAGYQLDDYVADDVEFLEQLGAGAVTLVGAATGGNIAALVASRRPDLVRTLILADPGFSLDPGLNERVQAEIASGHTYPSRAAATAAMPFSALWTAAMRAHYAEHAFLAAADGTVTARYRQEAAQETEAALEQDLWDHLSVRCPTLAMRGVLSPVFDRPRMLRLAAAVPQAVLVEVPRASHRVMQDNPAFVAAVIDGFLDAIEGA